MFSLCVCVYIVILDLIFERALMESSLWDAAGSELFKIATPCVWRGEYGRRYFSEQFASLKSIQIARLLQNARQAHRRER